MFLVDLAKKFDIEKVPYALVGGLAVALHGAARGTVDIDLVLKLQLKYIKKAVEVFRDFGMQSRIPITPENLISFRKEYIKNKNLIAWNFFDENDFSKNVDIIITEDLNKIKTVVKKVDGYEIKVASIKDLIKMKKKSNRLQDIEDIKSLKVLDEEN